MRVVLVLCLVTAARSWHMCADEHFCDRIRNNGHIISSFVLETNSLSYNSNVLEAVLINEVDNKTLTLSITALETEIFRINIDDPQNPRTRVPHALDGEPELENITIVETSNKLRISTGDSEALLEYSPFKIHVYKNDKVILIINDGNRLLFNSEDDVQAIAVDITFPKATTAYGIPLHAERMALQSTGPGGLDPYRLYNVDHCCYDNFIQDSLYGAEPLLYGHGVEGTTAVFWLNAAQTFVDISRENNQVQTFFISESGVMDIFVLTGPTFAEAAKQYINLTGPAPLPQYFTLGYHQSRWSYSTQDDAENVLKEFDNNDFPLETIWFDVDYMNDSKSFTWNYTAFPDPMGMQDFANSKRKKVLLIIHPHFKTEAGYFVYDTAITNDYFVKYANGSVFQGKGWPGPESSWLDFLNPEAATYFSELYGQYNFSDVGDNAYVWNDMNEPEVFDGFERSWPRSVMHYGNISNRDVHNIYGLSQVRATYAGLLARYQNRKRPFILSRSHFSGSQRYTIVWTGDNNSTWSHLQISFPMCLSLAISGISFCGADVGGFNGNLTDELFQRWYQAGAWLPFYRGHSTRFVERREPYLYSEEVQTRIRNAIKERYSYLPLWYTLFYEHERYGDPVIRPLVYNYPTDVNTHDIDDQWLVGADVLVKPVAEPNVTELRVYFPGGTTEIWIDMVNNSMYNGVGYVTIPITMDSIPVYHRGGSILSRKETHRSASGYMHSDPYSVYIFLDHNNQASGTVYMDDNESFDYRNKIYNYYNLKYNSVGLNISKIDSDAFYDQGLLAMTKIIVYRSPEHYTKAVVNSSKEYSVSYGPDNIYFIVEDLDITVTENLLIEFV